MKKKNDLIDEILNIEIDMFERVPAESSECQESPEAFKTTRKANFETWSQDTLKSYFNDLEEAIREDRNLMTEKYAKIDGKFPMTGIDFNIDKIIEIEEIWHDKLNEKYPHILKSDEERRHGVSFWKIYQRAELETYSSETLELLLYDFSNALDEGRNLLEETYKKIGQMLGYNSLQEFEDDLKED